MVAQRKRGMYRDHQTILVSGIKESVPLPKTNVDPFSELSAGLRKMCHLSKTALLMEFDTWLVGESNPANDGMTL